ncbi:DNA/RNA nuclease SfsA [Trichlorobacter lovleyi]|uniref:Sugar fermentation stimulation protein homolog n=1 Tax=Trichlorobacter lovleyi (strain ATCC BAA-1151 / DSM 17278 / SZ) TaxID=398767 RepID=B3E253_TRIL1|nr:DNA/RNA nuclease SfsA [Trichlorobacter lovleyi]ACD97156.1 sugar fermentation stimulation protein [Trichlorobacter lovleyi SZ]
MKLPDLIPGRLIKRYKRFLADIELEDCSVVTAHCPNSGSMLGCNLPGSPVLLSLSPNPNRKLAYTWELLQVNGFWVGLNTMLPNRLAEEAILDGTIVELQGYPKLRREVAYGSERSRIDILLEDDGKRCYVEVKNVTLVEGGLALFPDAVTARGQKHLRELMEMVRNGDRAVLLFTVQRGDGNAVAPADRIDPEYGRLLREAVANGVEALAYRAEVQPEQIRLTERLAVLL